MEIIYPYEILNYFLHNIKYLNIIFFLFMFYKIFYERIMYINIYILYIIFPTMIFFGKSFILYMANFIENDYLNFYSKILLFLLYNFIILINLRLIYDWREHLKNFLSLIKLISKIFNPIKYTYPSFQNARTLKTKVKQTKPQSNQNLRANKRVILDSLIVYSSTNKKVDLYEDNKKRGGEALLYETTDGYLAKIFHKNNINLEYKKDIIQKLKNMNFSNSIITPTEILFDEKQNFIGYMMPKKEGIELGKLLLKKVTDYFPKYKLIDIIDLSISITKAFEEIKSKSIVVGDINPRNILVKNKDNIFIIDTDSFQINKPSHAYMEEYRRPKYRNKDISSYMRTYKDDCYAVTTIIFQLLHFGLLPYGGTDEESLKEAKYVFNPYYPEKNLIKNKVLINAHNRLSHDLKIAFRDVFKYDKSVLISTLKTHLQAYRQMLSEVQN